MQLYAIELGDALNFFGLSSINLPSHRKRKRFLTIRRNRTRRLRHSLNAQTTTSRSESLRCVVVASGSDLSEFLTPTSRCV